jgi:CheY-like chemotaxis protein
MSFGGDSVVLWCLRGHGRDVRCTYERTRTGLELRVLWGDELFLTETFRDEDPLVRRAEEFRETLEARGWRRLAADSSSLDDEPWLSGGEPDDFAEHDLHPQATETLYAPPSASRRPSVLIVDDEATIRSFMRSYLEESMYAVYEAADVDSALAVLDDSPIDAVVLDIRMPDPQGWGRTGLEVLAFLRLHVAFASLPVLILTGYPLDPDEEDLARRHRAHVFHKPEGYRALLKRLDQLTGRREISQH